MGYTVRYGKGYTAHPSNETRARFNLILKAQLIVLPSQLEDAQRIHTGGLRMHEPSVKMPADPVTPGEGALLVFNWKKKRHLSGRKPEGLFLP